YTLAAPLSGTGLVTVASGVLTLGGDSPAFDGNIVVQPGATLMLNGPGPNGLGSTLGTTTIQPGATLDVANTVANSANLAGTEPVIVSGSGVGGAGAITNSN